jgi:RNA polymerase sigma-70 factor (ECF subfamily)
VKEDSSSRQSDLQSLSCEQLAWRSQRGCQAAYEELVHRYAGRLLRFLRRMTGDQNDAEDLLQETFVRAYVNIHTYRCAWEFSTWLYTIARRLASSHYRRSRHVTTRARVAPGSPDPADLACADEDRQSLWSAARDLPGAQYEALWLRYGEDMSIKQIATILRKSQVSVRVLLYRARIRLAERLRAGRISDIAGFELTRREPACGGSPTLHSYGDGALKKGKGIRCSAGSTDC